MTWRASTLPAVVILALAAGCHGADEREGQAAVRTYLDLLCKAYRASDAGIVDPLLDDAQGLKVTGLIGVKQDLGILLDATLLELRFDQVTRDGAALVVETHERWRYLDRRIGSGAPAGPESTDAYAMRYRFERKAGKLLLVDLAFIEQPTVGRGDPGYRLDAQSAHGVPQGGEPGAPPAEEAGRSGEKAR